MKNAFYLENNVFEKGFFDVGNGIGDLGNRFYKGKLHPSVRHQSKNDI